MVLTLPLPIFGLPTGSEWRPTNGWVATETLHGDGRGELGGGRSPENPHGPRNLGGRGVRSLVSCPALAGWTDRTPRRCWTRVFSSATAANPGFEVWPAAANGPSVSWCRAAENFKGGGRMLSKIFVSANKYTNVSGGDGSILYDNTVLNGSTLNTETFCSGNEYLTEIKSNHFHRNS